jgi:biopolymer transport protein ExbD
MIFGGSSRVRAFTDDGSFQSVALNLTALMDILSNLLFFLLASYTTQSLEVEQKANLRLPASSSQLTLLPALNVSVTQKQILVANVPVVDLEGDRILGTVEADDKIVPLYDRLKSVKAARAAAGRDDLPESDLVLLLADRDTDSSVITRVLRTAGMAGFVNIRFGVIAR